MKNKLLFLITKHTVILIEQTKTKPQETLEFKLNKQMETFSFNLPINLCEEGKWLWAVTSFEATKSVSNITDENNSFSTGRPGYWMIPNYLLHGIIDQLKNLLDLRSQNGIELHVKEFEQRSNRIEKENKGYSLADFDHCKSELLAHLGESKLS